VTVDFAGRFVRDEAGADGDEIYSRLRRDSAFNAVGAVAELALIDAPSIAIRGDNAPNEWGEITRPTVWRIMAHILDRYSTATALMDLWWSDESDAYILPSPTSIPSGSMLAALQELAESI